MMPRIGPPLDRSVLTSHKLSYLDETHRSPPTSAVFSTICRSVYLSLYLLAFRVVGRAETNIGRKALGSHLDFIRA